MRQVKVNKTEIYKDLQGEHLVCKGRLVKLFIQPTRENNWNPVEYIIISEVEDIEVGHKVYDIDQKCIVTYNKYDEVLIYYKKILASPEQLSPKHLQAIVDGKLKDGDEVYVECEEHKGRWITPTGIYGEGYCGPSTYSIALFLPEPGSIKLFPISKEESWIDNFNKYCEYAKKAGFKMDSSVNYGKWLEENYHLPKIK